MYGVNHGWIISWAYCAQAQGTHKLTKIRQRTTKNRREATKKAKKTTKRGKITEKMLYTTVKKH